MENFTQGFNPDYRYVTYKNYVVEAIRFDAEIINFKQIYYFVKSRLGPMRFYLEIMVDEKVIITITNKEGSYTVTDGDYIVIDVDKIKIYKSEEFNRLFTIYNYRGGIF